MANGVLDIIFYFLLKHGLKKEIAPDGKAEKIESEKTSGSDAQVGKEEASARENASAREDVSAREDASVKEDAAETVSENQNDQNTNADADTVSKEPQEEVLEEWKD